MGLADLFGRGINSILIAQVTDISGDKFVSLLRVKRSSTGEVVELRVKAVFISVGVVPTTEIIKKAGVEMDDRGFIKVDRSQKTNINGVFAADAKLVLDDNALFRQVELLELLGIKEKDVDW
jgi:thioredoxin reductase